MNGYELKIAMTGKPGRVEGKWCGVSQSRQEPLTAVWEETALDLSRMALAMGVDPAYTDDVIQDVYLIAWQKAPSRADREELRRWLFKVTVNRCHLEHRRNSRWRSVLRSAARLWTAAPSGDNVEAEASRNEERELVRQGLNALAPRFEPYWCCVIFPVSTPKKSPRSWGFPTQRCEASCAMCAAIGRGIETSGLQT